MKQTISIFLILLSLTLFAQKNEVKAVKTSFENYKEAILNDRGKEAVQFVDSRTMKYYGDLLEHVKLADSTAVEGLSLIDKLMVFTIRHRATKDDILSFDGKGLLVYAIESGMVGKNSVANSSIGDVTIDGSFAKGQYVSNGQKAPFSFHFYKEEENWKVDLTSVFPASTMALKKFVEDSGQPENEFIFSLLEMITGKKPGAEIWLPTKG